MSKTSYIGTSWKMNKLQGDARSYAERLREFTSSQSLDGTQLFVIPPFTSISVVSEALGGTSVIVGAQNIYYEAKGAFTGEVSAAMVRDAGATVVELGHSERRHIFGESDEWINKKVHAALSQNLVALVCVGETAFEREWGTGREFVARQVKLALHEVPAASFDKIWIAYEPVWAIGVGGTPAEPDYANDIHASIREAIVEQCGDAGTRIPVIYGGSVNLSNAAQYVKQEFVDGLFVGRAALDVEGFIALAEIVHGAP